MAVGVAGLFVTALPVDVDEGPGVLGPANKSCGVRSTHPPSTASDLRSSAQSWYNQASKPSETAEQADISTIMTGVKAMRPLLVWMPHDRGCLPRDWFGAANQSSTYPIDLEWKPVSKVIVARELVSDSNRNNIPQ